MPEYKLTYFNIRARGEPVRTMLKLAGVDYEEKLFAFGSDQWKMEKSDNTKYPFNQLPVLEVDGTPISQSMAIMRYLGKEHGYAPSCNLEQAQADAIVDQCQDLIDQFIWLYFTEQDPERKEKQRKNWFENKLPPAMKNFEAILKRNGTGYFVGDKITYADIGFFSLFNVYLARGKPTVPNEFAGYPLISALYERITKEPRIAAYLKTRPDAFI